MEKGNFKKIQNELQNCVQQITIIAVTKGRSGAEVTSAIESGVTAIGENRIEEAEEKLEGIADVERHFIGNIQSRKIARIVELFDVIQSVSSLKHLQKIDQACMETDTHVRVLLQFNTTDTGRQGFTEDDITPLVSAIKKLNAVSVAGVMGMASHGASDDQIHEEFRELRRMRDTLQNVYPEVSELSMGMSSDYLIAAQEGATIVRLGRVLFDPEIAA